MIRKGNFYSKTIQLLITIVFSFSMNVFSWGTCGCLENLPFCPDDVHAKIAEIIIDHSSIKTYRQYYGLSRNGIIDAARQEPKCFGVEHPGWSIFTSGHVFEYPVSNEGIGVILHVIGDAGIPVGYHSPAVDVWDSKNAEVQVYGSGQIHIDEITNGHLNNLYQGNYNTKLNSFYNAQTALAADYLKWYSNNPYAKDPSYYAKNGIINALRLGQAVLSEFFKRQMLPDRDDPKYDGMVAYWKMDDPSDAMGVMDCYGPLHTYMGDRGNGELMMYQLAGPVPVPITKDFFPNRTTGIIDQAIHFGGKHSVRIPAINNDEITLLLWFNRDINNNANVMPIFSGSRSYIDEQQQEGFELYFTSDSPNTIKFRLASKNSSGTRMVKTCSYDLGNHLNEWHHVACSYSKSSGTQCLYVDGRKVNTQYHQKGNTIVPLTTYNYMWFAFSPDKSSNNSSSGYNGFAGKIDDVKLYSKSLSYKEIAAECGKNPPYMTSIIQLLLD